jgi:hypothetical protein
MIAFEVPKGSVLQERRVRDFNGRGFNEQVRGFVRDASASQ